MPVKRIFRFAYHASQRSDMRFRLHQLRDGDAFIQLSTIFYGQGYEYGVLLLNLPSDEQTRLSPFDGSFLTPSDLIILNTRPPIHDDKAEDKHLVRRSYTELENSIFDAVSPGYLEWCARSRIKLSKRIAELLHADYKNRADIHFHSMHDGSYLRYRGYQDRYWQTPSPEKKRTAAYLIHISTLWEGGPGMFAAFGMAGTETLAWNYLLRTRFRHWIDDYQFLMAELSPRQLPNQPMDLSFADNWEVIPILSIRL